MRSVESLIQYASLLLEVVGVGAILGGAILAFLTAIVLLGRRLPGLRIYRVCRSRLGRSILIGLEFLVAADIINTVAVKPSFGSVGTLAAIVLIRTFLSLTLEVEMNGRWPWQGPPET